MLERDRKRSLRVSRAAWLIGVSVREYREIEAGDREPNPDVYQRISELVRVAADDSIRIVCDESLAEADDVIKAVSRGTVEGDDVAVLGPDLEVHLRAAARGEESFGLRHELAAYPPPSPPRVHGQVVDPSAVTLVACHHRTDENLIVRRDQE